jgi:carboxymethylenebutenolidase
MCFSPDASPPTAYDTPSSPATRHTLAAADGASVLVASANPSGDSRVRRGVVILPDNRGLQPYYDRLAEGVAAAGFHAIAVDYYGRTAGTGPRTEGFPHMEHLFQVTRDGLDADVRAAIAWLRSSEGGACASVGVLGFCFGGRQAFMAARSEIGADAVIGFYGLPGVMPMSGAPGPTQLTTSLRAPILAIFGGADTGIPAAEIEAFDAALTDASVEHQVITYDDAPHSFFDIHCEEHRAASEDAWQRTLAFLERHLSPLVGRA